MPKEFISAIFWQVKTPVLFFTTKVTKLSWRDGSDRSLRRHFPTDDSLLQCGDIRDQVAELSEIARNFDVFGWPNYGRGIPT